MNAFATEHNSQAFSRLFVSPRFSLYGRRQCLEGLRQVGKHCVELVFLLEDATNLDAMPAGAIFTDIDRIREFPNQSHPSFHVRDKRLKEQAQRDVHSLGGPKQASRPPSPSSPFTECSDWPSVFRETPKIETLKILSRNKDGTLSTPAPEALIAWRMAFDTANLSRIYCLRIDALPVSHLLQLRWSGMEAFGKASWQAQRTWSRIKLLDVTISDPPKNAQPRIVRQHMKVLYSWLSSFADSLEELRFEWRERRGPNPMTLPQLQRVQLQMPVIQWKKLRTYYFNGEMVPF